MKTIILNLSWSVSRGRDTYGYTICRLDDTDIGKRYRCNGGGYDMVGTVLGQWLSDRYADRLLAIKERAHVTYTYPTDDAKARTRSENNSADRLYGMALIEQVGSGKEFISLDGACGSSSMLAIAKAIGLEVRYMPTVGRSRTSKGFIVTDTKAEA